MKWASKLAKLKWVRTIWNKIDSIKLFTLINLPLLGKSWLFYFPCLCRIASGGSFQLKNGTCAEDEDEENEEETSAQNTTDACPSLYNILPACEYNPAARNTPDSSLLSLLPLLPLTSLLHFTFDGFADGITHISFWN